MDLIQRPPDNLIIRVGIAGWSIPKEQAPHFPDKGSHLERYAQVFPVVEINSSFYRPHRPSTYERWARSTPDSFRFSVKVPREITHFTRLRDVTLLDRFLAEAIALDNKLGPFLVQLPPRLHFDPALAQTFFRGFRERYPGQVVCEPRHASWFVPEADDLFHKNRISRVAADPSITPAAALPGGWEGMVYYRLHGSPKMYYSAYSDQSIADLAAALISWKNRAAEVWCIFDNTAEGAAYSNAIELIGHIGKTGSLGEDFSDNLR